jgi:type I restriction enzyme M protein
VRFIVNVVNPKVGEVVLDPAAGTGGFLVEAYEHLKKQCNKAEDYEKLQRGSLLGIEAKPLPYLLCQMNLLLHGLEYPEIDPGNALRFPLREIGDKDRVDIIMTNPPFGGEEEKGILSNFPEDKQTSETALLFLQLIMRKLKRPIGGKNGGRCGMVVHNGVLFGDGVCAKVKEELLNEFNLHTIVRLPAGVFSPYTDIETNLLFFEKGGPTKEIWYYELPLPEGRKNYTKTRPLQFEEFESCLKWWNNRVENEFAWKVPVEEVSKNNYNLDIKNPNKKNDFEHLPPEKLLESILEKEKKVIEIIEKIKVEINQGKVMIKNSVKNYKFKDFLARAKDRIIIKENEDYKRLTIKTKNGGIFIRDKVLGSLIGTKKQFIVKSGQFLLSKIDAMNGAFGIVPSECDEAIITGNFWAFNVSKNIVDLEFLNYFTFTTNFIDLCMKASTGTTHRKYLDETKFLELEISLPLLSEQQHIVSILKRINSINKIKLEIQSEINALVPSILSKAFKGEL